MGRRSRPAAQRPLDYPHRLSDRIEYRCALIELALSACHRIGILLQKNAECYRQRFVNSAIRFNGARCSRALRHRTGYRESRRLVWTVVRQRTRNVIQFGRSGLYHSACGRSDLGCIRKLHRKEQSAHGYLLYPDDRFAGYPILRTRSQQYHHRYFGYCRTGTLSCSECTG